MAFDPQYGAVTQGRIGQGYSQSNSVQKAAASHTALKGAQLREHRSQYERMLKQNQEQFNTKMGVEKSQFNQQQAFAKKQQEYMKKKGEKAERLAKIGTTIQVGQLGLGLANEYDVNLAKNLGFQGEGFDDTAAFGGANEQGGGQVVTGADMEAYNAKIASGETFADGDIDADEGTTGGVRGHGIGESGTGQGWWDSWGSTAAAGGLGGAMGGMMGANVATALFGEGKTQSTAGGAVGGAAGGYAATGTTSGGLWGAAVGGLMGYFLG